MKGHDEKGGSSSTGARFGDDITNSLSNVSRALEATRDRREDGRPRREQRLLVLDRRSIRRGQRQLKQAASVLDIRKEAKRNRRADGIAIEKGGSSWAGAGFGDFRFALVLGVGFVSLPTTLVYAQFSAFIVMNVISYVPQ